MLTRPFLLTRGLALADLKVPAVSGTVYSYFKDGKNTAKAVFKDALFVEQQCIGLIEPGSLDKSAEIRNIYRKNYQVPESAQTVAFEDTDLFATPANTVYPKEKYYRVPLKNCENTKFNLAEFLDDFIGKNKVASTPAALPAIIPEETETIITDDPIDGSITANPDNRVV